MSYSWLRTLQYLLSFFLLLLSVSCQKESAPAGTASLTMVNAVAGSNSLVVNFAGDGAIHYYTAQQLRHNAYTNNVNQYNAYSGARRIRLFNFPDTLEKDKPVFDLRLDLPIGSISSLFLTGTIDAPDTMLVHDVIPFFQQNDSAMAVRFVNLTPGSSAVSVNIKGAPNGSEVASLGYKAITDFKRYAVNPSLNDYVFEFRDVASGDLLASFTTQQLNNPGQPNPNTWIYRSFTIALAGTPGGTGNDAPTAILINHY